MHNNDSLHPGSFHPLDVQVRTDAHKDFRNKTHGRVKSTTNSAPANEVFLSRQVVWSAIPKCSTGPCLERSGRWAGDPLGKFLWVPLKERENSLLRFQRFDNLWNSTFQAVSKAKPNSQATERTFRRKWNKEILGYWGSENLFLMKSWKCVKCVCCNGHEA